MSHRRLAAATAVLAAAVAFVPGTASAAGSPPPAGARAVPGSPFAGGGPANLTSFESDAAKAYRPQLTPLRSGSELSRDTGSGKTLYTVTDGGFCQGTGLGTKAAPYCHVQAAVDAAAPGDTIQVLGRGGYYSTESITVRTSNITIVGDDKQPWIAPGGETWGKPALVLDGVTGVKVAHLRLSAGNTHVVEVRNSSDITFDSDYIDGYAADVLAVDGASRDVTVTRTYLDSDKWAKDVSAIAIAEGASRVTLAGNLIAASGITATGVKGLTVTGNTVQRGCSTGLAVLGTSSDVSVQNNLFEDSNDDDTYFMAGFKSFCTEHGHSWDADVTVSAESAPGTTADYNAFYVYRDYATAPYDWAGTVQPGLEAFRAATGQGAHDLDDTKKAYSENLHAVGEQTVMDFRPTAGSAVIGTANPDAPGRLDTDFFGVSPYNSRGAVQYVNANPTLALAIKVTQTSAYGIALTTDVTSGSGIPLVITADWGDGTNSVYSRYGGFNEQSAHSYAEPGRYTVTVTVKDNTGESVANAVRVETAGTHYTAYGPVRLLDTRDGTGAALAKVQPFSSARVKIGGTGGIPEGVVAAVLNLTVTNTAKPGFITAFGEGDGRPSTSNVNFSAGQTVPNLAIVPVGANGWVDLYNGSPGTVNLIADITGYFGAAKSSGYTAVDPVRLVDTRDGTGTARGQVPANGSFTVQIAGNGRAQLPASGITAVALNMTVTEPQAAGFLTAYPEGQTRPLASNVNFGRGQTIANAVVVPVGQDGRIRVFNGSPAGSSVVVDVVGYYSAASTAAYIPINPSRVLDTRDPAWKYGQLKPGNYIYIPFFTTRTDVPALALNTTVTNTRGAGFLTVSPDPNRIDQYQYGGAVWPNRPLVSVLNWLPGQTVPNLVQASTGHNGIVDFWNSGTGNMDLIVDAFGYYMST
ncbi:parallel beta helix pectate lyase-like protein [Streptomyces sp. TLI_235]|nr:parallel beta helix pectate lyase-like protein [Streptomyces sp. TLI_235]